MTETCHLKTDSIVISPVGILIYIRNEVNQMFRLRSDTGLLVN